MRGLLIAVLFVLGACGPLPGAERGDADAASRQQPSVTTPGVHVSGYATVGVVRSF